MSANTIEVNIPQIVKRRIPEPLQNLDFRFILIGLGKKLPFEEGWQTIMNYSYQERPFLTHLLRGGNWGVATGYGNLCVIDVDEKSFSPIVRNYFPPTFTVETGSGGHHYYLTCPGLDKKRLLHDKDSPCPACEGSGKQIELCETCKGRGEKGEENCPDCGGIGEYKVGRRVECKTCNGIGNFGPGKQCDNCQWTGVIMDYSCKSCNGEGYPHLGEVQYQGQQVVGPGSLHPSGRKYLIKRNLPIAEIELDKLLEFTDRYKKPEKTAIIYKKGEVPKKYDKVRSRKPGDNRESKYDINFECSDLTHEIPGMERMDGYWIGPHPRLASKGGKCMTIKDGGGYVCWNCETKGGRWKLLAILEGIIECDDAGRELTEEEFRRVWEAAKKRGLVRRNPRFWGN